MLGNNVLSNKYVVDGFNRNLYPDWVKFISEKEPRFFITFTIKELTMKVNEFRKYTRKNVKLNTYDSESLVLVNKLLHFVNYDLFTRKYKQKGKFLDGFGCLEHQKNGQPHFHFLITNDIEEKIINLSFKKKIRKIYQTDKKGFDFQYIGDDKNEQKIKTRYITKMIDKGVMNIGVLSKDGLLM